MPPSLADRVAGVGTTTVAGTFYRHAAPNRDAFAGSTLGRWGLAVPVVYLGRPPASVVAEAYRHLVDPYGIDPSAVRPRVLYTVTVAVRLVLDLTVPAHRRTLGLTEAALCSSVDDYEPCQRVADAAHERGLHGILAPAATRLGETLALFAERLDPAERPRVVQATAWPRLPADPRG